MATRTWRGSPTKIWGVEVRIVPGTTPPSPGDSVEVIASNGKKWTAPVLAVHTHNEKSGRCVIITPTKRDNPNSSEQDEG